MSRRRPTPLTIGEALRDRNLLGALPAFRRLETWAPWLTFLDAVYGQPLDAAAEARFGRHTGRSRYAPPPGGWREAVVITGRQSGKTRIAAALAVFEAITAAREPDRTELYALMVAQDHRAALRVLLRYARAPFDLVPLLRPLVSDQTSEAVTLTSGVTLAAYPCRPAAVRGLRARVVAVDELAFFRSSDGYPTDVEMLRAVRPTLATTGGRLIVLSSPYGQAGALWELHRRHFGQDDAPVLVWQASAPDMNPTLPKDYLQRMAEDDPEAYRAEVLGEFRAGVATLLDPEALEAVVPRGVRERPPIAGSRYCAFADPSGGRADRFAVAVAHAEGDGGVVLDAVRAWAPPFNPSGVIAEAAALMRGYGITTVRGDRFGGEFVAEGFRGHGIRYEPAPLDRSAIYLELLPRVNAGAVQLLDLPELLRELRGLERRRGASGRDRVDHIPGAHDDLANAAAGALVAAQQPKSAATVTAVHAAPLVSPRLAPMIRVSPVHFPSPRLGVTGDPRAWP
jgi:hypothetical protein